MEKKQCIKGEAIPPTTQEECNSLGFQKNEMVTIQVDPPILVHVKEDNKRGGNSIGLVTMYEQYRGWIRIGILLEGDKTSSFFFPESFKNITPIEEIK